MGAAVRREFLTIRPVNFPPKRFPIFTIGAALGGSEDFVAPAKTRVSRELVRSGDRFFDSCAHIQVKPVSDDDTVAPGFFCA